MSTDKYRRSPLFQSSVLKYKLKFTLQQLDGLSFKHAKHLLVSEVAENNKSSGLSSSDQIFSGIQPKTLRIISNTVWPVFEMNDFKYKRHQESSFAFLRRHSLQAPGDNPHLKPPWHNTQPSPCSEGNIPHLKHNQHCHSPKISLSHRWQQHWLLRGRVIPMVTLMACPKAPSQQSLPSPCSAGTPHSHAESRTRWLGMTPGSSVGFAKCRHEFARE